MELVAGGLHGEEIDLATDELSGMIISWCNFQNSILGLLYAES